MIITELFIRVKIANKFLLKFNTRRKRTSLYTNRKNTFDVKKKSNEKNSGEIGEDMIFEDILQYNDEVSKCLRKSLCRKVTQN